MLIEYFSFVWTSMYCGREPICSVCLSSGLIAQCFPWFAAFFTCAYFSQERKVVEAQAFSPSGCKSNHLKEHVWRSFAGIVFAFDASQSLFYVIAQLRCDHLPVVCYVQLRVVARQIDFGAYLSLVGCFA